LNQGYFFGKLYAPLIKRGIANPTRKINMHTINMVCGGMDWIGNEQCGADIGRNKKKKILCRQAQTSSAKAHRHQRQQLRRGTPELLYLIKLLICSSD